MPGIEFEKHEIISDAAIEQIKDYNRFLCDEIGAKYCANDDILRQIFHRDINEKTDIVDTCHRLAKKSANVIYYMIRRRPFCSLNAFTAIATVIAYLKGNGKRLSYSQADELRRLVEEQPSQEVVSSRNLHSLRSAVEKFLLENL